MYQQNPIIRNKPTLNNKMHIHFNIQIVKLTHLNMSPFLLSQAYTIY